MSFTVPKRAKREPGRRVGGLARIFIRSMKELKDNELARVLKKESESTNKTVTDCVGGTKVNNDSKALSHQNHRKLPEHASLHKSKTEDNIWSSTNDLTSTNGKKEEGTGRKTSEDNKSLPKDHNGKGDGSAAAESKQVGNDFGMKRNYSKEDDISAAHHEENSLTTERSVSPLSKASKVANKESYSEGNKSTIADIKSKRGGASTSSKLFTESIKINCQDGHSCLPKHRHRPYSQRRHSNSSRERDVEKLESEDWSSDLLEVEGRGGNLHHADTTEQNIVHLCMEQKCNDGNVKTIEKTANSGNNCNKADERASKDVSEVIGGDGTEENTSQKCRSSSDQQTCKEDVSPERKQIRNQPNDSSHVLTKSLSSDVSAEKTDDNEMNSGQGLEKGHVVTENFDQRLKDNLDRHLDDKVSAMLHNFGEVDSEQTHVKITYTDIQVFPESTGSNDSEGLEKGDYREDKLKNVAMKADEGHEKRKFEKQENTEIKKEERYKSCVLEKKETVEMKIDESCETQTFEKPETTEIKKERYKIKTFEKKETEDSLLVRSEKNSLQQLEEVCEEEKNNHNSIGPKCVAENAEISKPGEKPEIQDYCKDNQHSTQTVTYCDSTCTGDRDEDKKQTDRNGALPLCGDNQHSTQTVTCCDSTGDIDEDKKQNDRKGALPLHVPVCDVPFVYNRLKNTGTMSGSDNSSNFSSKKNFDKSDLIPKVEWRKPSPWRENSSASSDSSYTARSSRPRPKKPKRKFKHTKSMARGHTLTVSPISTPLAGSPSISQNVRGEKQPNTKSTYNSMIHSKVEAMAKEMKAKVLTPPDSKARQMVSKPTMYRDSLRAMKQVREENDPCHQIPLEQEKKDTSRTKLNMLSQVSSDRESSESTGCEYVDCISDSAQEDSTEFGSFIESVQKEGTERSRSFTELLQKEVTEQSRSISVSTQKEKKEYSRRISVSSEKEITGCGNTKLTESLGSKSKSNVILVQPKSSDQRKEKAYVHVIKAQVSSEPQLSDNQRYACRHRHNEHSQKEESISGKCFRNSKFKEQHRGEIRHQEISGNKAHLGSKHGEKLQSKNVESQNIVNARHDTTIQSTDKCDPSHQRDSTELQDHIKGNHRNTGKPLEQQNFEGRHTQILESTGDSNILHLGNSGDLSKSEGHSTRKKEQVSERENDSDNIRHVNLSSNSESEGQSSPRGQDNLCCTRTKTSVSNGSNISGNIQRGHISRWSNSFNNRQGSHINSSENGIKVTEHPSHTALHLNNQDTIRGQNRSENLQSTNIREDNVNQDYKKTRSFILDNSSQGHNRNGLNRQKDSSQGQNRSESVRQDNLPQGHSKSERFNQDNRSQGHSCYRPTRQEDSSQSHNRTESVRQDNLPQGHNKSERFNQDNLPQGHNKSERFNQDNRSQGHSCYRPTRQEDSSQGHNRTESLRQDNLSHGCNRTEVHKHGSYFQTDKSSESGRLESSLQHSHVETSIKKSSMIDNGKDIVRCQSTTENRPNRISESGAQYDLQDGQQNCSQFRPNLHPHSGSRFGNERLAVADGLIPADTNYNHAKTVDSQRRPVRSDTHNKMDSKCKLQKQAGSITGQNILKDKAIICVGLEGSDENWDIDLLSVAPSIDSKGVGDRERNRINDVSETSVLKPSTDSNDINDKGKNDVSETSVVEGKLDSSKVFVNGMSHCVQHGSKFRMDNVCHKHVENSDKGIGEISGICSYDKADTQKKCEVQTTSDTSDRFSGTSCNRTGRVAMDGDNGHTVYKSSTDQHPKLTNLHERAKTSDDWRDSRKLDERSRKYQPWDRKDKYGLIDNGLSSKDSHTGNLDRGKTPAVYPKHSSVERKGTDYQRKCPWSEALKQPDHVMEEIEENWDANLLDIEGILKTHRQEAKTVEQVVPGGQELSKTMTNDHQSGKFTGSDLRTGHHQLEEWESTVLDLNLISGVDRINSDNEGLTNKERHVLRTGQVGEADGLSDCSQPVCNVQNDQPIHTVQENEGSVIPQSDCSLSESRGMAEFEDNYTSDDVMDSYVFLSQEECDTRTSTDQEMDKLYNRHPNSPVTFRPHVSSDKSKQTNNSRNQKYLSSEMRNDLQPPPIYRRKNRPPGYGPEECVCPPGCVQYWTWRCCYCRWGWEPRICDIRSALDISDYFSPPTTDDKDTTDLGLRMRYRPRGILAMGPNRIPPPPSRELWNQMQQGAAPVYPLPPRGTANPYNRAPHPQLPRSYPSDSRKVVCDMGRSNPYGLSSVQHSSKTGEQSVSKGKTIYSYNPSEYVAKDRMMNNGNLAGKQQTFSCGELMCETNGLSSDDLQDLQLNSPKLVDYGFSETDDSEEEKKESKSRVVLFGKDDQDSDCSSENKRKLDQEDQDENNKEDVTSKRRHVLPPSNIYHFIRHSVKTEQSTTKEPEKKTTAYVPPHRRQTVELPDSSHRDSPSKPERKKQATPKDYDLNVSSPTSKPSPSPGSYPWTPFWASPPHPMTVPVSPLYGYHQPPCPYPPGYYYHPTDWYHGNSAGESYGGAYPQTTRTHSNNSTAVKTSTSSPTATKENLQTDVKSPERLVLPPRIKFLERTRLLGHSTDSESSSSFPLVDWKANFKEKCKRYCGTFIDSHCHLDFLFNRQSYRGTWSKYKILHEATMPHSFEGCVAVFCHPSSFRSEGLWRDIALEEDVWLAFGCHPKNATEFSPRAEEGLLRCLQHKRVVALGEIGLDYSGIFKQHQAIQKSVFIKQIQLALEINKPLVIHCRDAEEDCLQILEKTVPRNYRIHCHCFTGNYESAKKWLDLFPNLYIGLTPLVTYRTATPTHEVARFIPLDRLLLETDAPYFIPRKFPKEDVQFSHPGMAITVAEHVAFLKRCSVTEVLHACRQNTRTMYGV
ncbi:uncharacterized protein [Argopecten irradians]|uniref:uncharacterized protein n=1 Tax=Argopecten irradians TaxID=31199 RepID=UPI00371F796D